jgi:hypothetical protein
VYNAAGATYTVTLVVSNYAAMTRGREPSR